MRQSWPCCLDQEWLPNSSKRYSGYERLGCGIHCCGPFVGHHCLVDFYYCLDHAMVTAKKTTKTAPKAPAKVAAVKRSIPKTVKATPAPKNQNNVDKVIGLIQWVDNPFKLFTVILLSFLFFAGYFAWDSRQVILQAITTSSHHSELKDTPTLMQIALSVQKDLEAETVTVHKASLVVNSRTTLFALNSKGHDKSMDGLTSTLFNKDPQRNQSMIAMLGGEVCCDKLVVTGKNSDWEEKQGVKFICRGSIPPQMGEFEGYISVGLREAPDDTTDIKTRINLATTEMSK